MRNRPAVRRNGALLGFTFGGSSPATTTASKRSRKGSLRILVRLIPGVPSLSETIASLIPARFSLLRVGSASLNGGLASMYALQYRSVTLRSRHRGRPLIGHAGKTHPHRQRPGAEARGTSPDS